MHNCKPIINCTSVYKTIIDAEHSQVWTDSARFLSFQRRNWKTPCPCPPMSAPKIQTYPVQVYQRSDDWELWLNSSNEIFKINILIITLAIKSKHLKLYLKLSEATFSTTVRWGQTGYLVNRQLVEVDIGWSRLPIWSWMELQHTSNNRTSSDKRVIQNILQYLLLKSQAVRSYLFMSSTLIFVLNHLVKLCQQLDTGQNNVLIISKQKIKKINQVKQYVFNLS